MRQFLHFILFALFLVLGGIFILNHEDKREVKIEAKIEALSNEIKIIKEEKKICDINLKNCNVNLQICQKEKDDFFKTLNKKND